MDTRQDQLAKARGRLIAAQTRFREEVGVLYPKGAPVRWFTHSQVISTSRFESTGRVIRFIGARAIPFEPCLLVENDKTGKHLRIKLSRVTG